MIDQLTTPDIYPLDPVDEIQSHILGVIASLMNCYGLNPTQVRARYEYVSTLNANNVCNSYIEHKNEVNSYPYSKLSSYDDSCASSLLRDEEVVLAEPDSVMSWGDIELDDVDTIDAIDSLAVMEEGRNQGPLYVKTRREFCNAMSSGIKICPRYSTCVNEVCSNFHIEPHFICSHNTKGNYCDDNTCELIVIRPCRKGKRCNDSDCSFRH